MENVIQKATEFATKAHAGSAKPVHRDGKDAIEHSLEVASSFKDEPEVYAIAVLHDVLEDCPDITFDDLVNEFGTYIAIGVQALSRMEGESWSAYINRVCQNPDAVRIKIKDIEHNISRADTKFNRNIKMYQDTLAHLHQLQLS